MLIYGLLLNGLEIFNLLTLSQIISVSFFKEEPWKFYLEASSYFPNLDIQPWTFLFFSLSIGYVVFFILQYKFNLKTASVGYNIAAQAFHGLKHLTYDKFISYDNAEITAILIPEAQRAASAVIMPALNFVIKFTLIVCIAVLVGVQAGLNVIFVGLIVVPYLIFLTITAKTLDRNNRKFSIFQKSRVNSIKFYGDAGKYLYFSDDYLDEETKFLNSSSAMGKILGLNTFLSIIPKYAIEYTIGLVSIVFLTVHPLGSINEFFTGEQLSLVMLAGIKIMPASQQCYRSLMQIRGNYSSFTSLIEFKNDVYRNNALNTDKPDEMEKIRNLLSLDEFIISDFNFELRHGINVQVPSMRVKSGSLVLVKGVSGIGKTTLIENLIGLRNNLRLSERFNPTTLGFGSERGNVAYVGQIPFFNFDNLKRTYFIEQNHLTKNLKDLIEKWGIEEIFKIPNASLEILSGGQKRKLACIRAFLQNRHFLVLDEPSNDLDAFSKKALVEYLSLISKEERKKVLLISHDEDFMSVADNVLEIKKI